MTVMTAMSENYGTRLGVDPAAITAAHLALANALFKDSKAPQAATA